MQDLLLLSTDSLVVACRLQQLHTQVLKHWTTREVPASAKLLLHFWRVLRFIRHHDQILLYMSSLIIFISQGNTLWLWQQSVEFTHLDQEWEWEPISSSSKPVLSLMSHCPPGSSFERLLPFAHCSGSLRSEIGITAAGAMDQRQGRCISQGKLMAILIQWELFLTTEFWQGATQSRFFSESSRFCVCVCVCVSSPSPAVSLREKEA